MISRLWNRWQWFIKNQCINTVWCTYACLYIISKPELLFKKIEDEEIDYQITKLTERSIENFDKKKRTPYNNFSKLNISVGSIIRLDQIKSFKNYKKFKINTGSKNLIIISEVSTNFNDKSFIGKKVSIITNLTPKKIKGEISEGHILSTKNEKGEIIFVIPDNNEIKDEGFDILFK